LKIGKISDKILVNIRFWEMRVFMNRMNKNYINKFKIYMTFLLVVVTCALMLENVYAAEKRTVKVAFFQWKVIT
jgi:hypothetical protein